MSKNKLAGLLNSKTAKFLVVSSEEQFQTLELADLLPNRNKTTLIHRQLKTKDCIKEWEEIFIELELIARLK
jgi:hypothetical protein